MTQVFSLEQIEQAAQLLREEQLVAFPTETVYGLGAPIFSPKAIAKIFQVKRRASDNPLIAHVADLKQAESIAFLSDDFYVLAKAFFPGPLTLVMKKRECVPDVASSGLDTIGVRMPAHPVVQELIRLVGQPIVAPSANLSGKPSATRVEHVLADFDGEIGGVIEGQCSFGLESTVLLLEPEPVLLRPGRVTKEELEAVLGKSIALAGETSEPRSPGMKYRHYAPNARLLLFETQEELQAHLRMFPDVTREVLDVCASRLYHDLREADRKGCEEIVALCDEKIRQDSALMNRLNKASQ